MIDENINTQAGMMLEFQYPNEGQMFTEEMIKYNTNVKKNINKMLQEQGALQPKIILRKHNRELIYGEAFIFSFFMNPYQQFKLQLNKIKGQPAKLEPVSPHFDTFWQLILKIFNPKDEAVNHLVTEYTEDGMSKEMREKVLQKILFQPISHIPYAIRRFSQFVGYQELNLIQQFIMATHFVLISSYNKMLLRHYKPQKIFDRLKIQFYENFIQLELFFLQRLNYHILYQYPEDFVEQYLHIIQQKYNTQPSEQIYKILLKTASISRVVLFVQPDVICQFCLLEALLIENSNLGPRQSLYNQTSRYKQLDQCRRQFFDYGQQDLNGVYDKLFPLNGNGLNLDNCLAFLSELFNNITVEYKQ